MHLSNNYEQFGIVWVFIQASKLHSSLTFHSEKGGGGGKGGGVAKELFCFTHENLFDIFEIDILHALGFYFEISTFTVEKRIAKQNLNLMGS